ncbi:SDR family NAD(P)-dependent oxidoreductase [Candidatus Margulisiibacteriota bacterium]
MQLKGKKVLVTGAAGFIGSHLTEELVRLGCKVRAFIHYNSQNNWENLELLPQKTLKQLEVFKADITDPFSVDKAVQGQDIVFHLAALIAIPYSYIAPQAYVQTNVMGTLNVMEACLRHGIKKVVHTSTSETFGTAMYAPIDEKHPLQGQSPYSASKIGADKIAESFYCSFKLPVVTLRPFNTFGPRQSARAVIPTIISQALVNKEVTLGSLDPVRDLTYVKDTAAGFIAAATSDKTVGELINIGNSKGITVGELADKIISLIDKNIKIISDKSRVRPEDSEVFKLICNNEKAKKIMGWAPKYSLEDGLKETIQFIKENLNLFKTDHYVI